MALVLKDLDARVKKAVARYWKTLATQSKAQKSGDADRGGRAAVMGGKPMIGFCEVVNQLLIDNGVPEAHIDTQAKLELPGYFRPTESWDMLVVHEGHLVAALGVTRVDGAVDDLIASVDGAVGRAAAVWAAYRSDMRGRADVRPWLGWIVLREHEPRAGGVVRRDEGLLRGLLRERLYDGVALLTATKAQGTRGVFREPANDLAPHRVFAGLVARAMTSAALR